MNVLSELEIREYNQAVLTRIRELCVRRSTSITKIEKALGFGNGTVSGWKNAKKKAPLERIIAIADFLDVPTMALTGESIQEKKPALKNENELDDTTKELVELAYELDDADRLMLLEMARSIRKRREG